MKHSYQTAKLLLINVALMLSACAVSNKESILPQGGATMKQVYDRHFSGQRLGSENSPESSTGVTSPMGQVRSLGNRATDLKGYSREAYNETQLIFQRLPNPDLVMYVFPHLSGAEGNPIPGYSTAFPFYDTVHYALPGELEGE
ncbi:TIGR03751 family conjugal transfer lipoprotein [Crenothrix polyspora]|uniref:Conjugative transfer region lipoprotein family n=1 Tax=Crenothrix polyspora TaxID=360316 RepID=A0A1R4H4A7_9GAMM|nr:TIGR03751 family conjugal transfer lipoprotein [Crenothrix polyspora]SJM91049.1 Conjugative transfer region lipoprotein family [Crenothrix polyspora]